MKKMCIAVLLVEFLCGCASLNTQQRSDYNSWKQQGVLVKEKNEGKAAALGILPGFGSFYTRRYGTGVVDLLLWPLSILWDPMVGYTTAKKINFEATNYKLNKGL